MIINDFTALHCRRDSRNSNRSCQTLFCSSAPSSQNITDRASFEFKKCCLEQMVNFLVKIFLGIMFKLASASAYGWLTDYI